MRSMLYKSTAVALTALLLGLGVAAATSSPRRPAPAYGITAIGTAAVGTAAIGARRSAWAFSASPPARRSPRPLFHGPGPYYGPGPALTARARRVRSLQPDLRPGGRYLGRRWVDICQ